MVVERIETNKVNSIGLLDISDNTTVNHLLEIIGKELPKDVSKDNRLKENWITTIKDLREAIRDSWIKWKLPMKLAEELRLRIYSEKGFLVDQSLCDLVCYVVDLSDVPKCGSFNPYGNEQMEDIVITESSSEEEVVKFLKEYNGGVFTKFVDSFKLFNGKSLLKLTKEDFETFAEDIELPKAIGTLLFRVLKPEIGMDIDAQPGGLKRTASIQLLHDVPKRSKGRMAATNLDSLIQSLKFLVPGHKIFEEPAPLFEYITDENATQKFIDCVKSNHSAFMEDIDTRTAHPFPIIATASGMGKSRFGKEAPKLLSSCLENIVSIMIDFNGGGDKLDPVRDVDPKVSLGLRLLAKGYFQCTTETLRQHILLEEEGLCLFSDVLIQIGNKIRSQTDGKSLVTIFLHLDEFQLAHETIKASSENFLKNIIYTIGEFKVRNSTQVASLAKEHNIFLLPLLTGTTRDGTALALTTYHADYISLDTLDPSSSLKILKKSLNNANFHSPLLDSNEFLTLLGDIGVVPKYLLWLRQLILNDVKILSQQTKDSVKVFQFAATLRDRFISARNLLEMLSNNQRELFRFLSHCILGTSVSWGTMYNGYTVETLARDGDIFIKLNSSSSLSFFFPCILLNLLATDINSELLRDITAFPYDNSWHKFEVIVLKLVLVRMNVLVLSGIGSLSFPSLFPDCLGTRLNYSFIVKNELQLSNDQRKWIYKQKNNPNLLFTEVSMSDGVYLCLAGNKYLDGRICCHTEDNKKVLIGLQMRKTDCNKYNMITHAELEEARKALCSQYKNNFDIIIVGGITNSPLSQEERLKFNNTDHIFCLSKTELRSFTLNLSHRF